MILIEIESKMTKNSKKNAFILMSVRFLKFGINAVLHIIYQHITEIVNKMSDLCAEEGLSPFIWRAE